MSHYPRRTNNTSNNYLPSQPNDNASMNQSQTPIYNNQVVVQMPQYDAIYQEANIQQRPPIQQPPAPDTQQPDNDRKVTYAFFGHNVIWVLVYAIETFTNPLCSVIFMFNLITQIAFLVINLIQHCIYKCCIENSTCCRLVIYLIYMLVIQFPVFLYSWFLAGVEAGFPILNLICGSIASLGIGYLITASLTYIVFSYYQYQRMKQMHQNKTILQHRNY